MKEIIEQLNAARRKAEIELTTITSCLRILGRGETHPVTKRKLSRAAIHNIRIAQKKRWQAWHKKNGKKTA